MLTDADLRRFFWRNLRVLVVALFACSVALNVFLLLPRPTIDLTTDEEGEIASSLTLGRWAFGVVHRPIATTEQRAPGTGSVLPVSRYKIPDGMIPTLSDEMALYRDQGTAMTQDSATEMLRALHVPFDLTPLALAPTSVMWGSPDKRYLASFDIASRTLAIRDTRTKELQEIPADDTLTVDLAKDFLAGLKISIPSGDPEIGTASVRWPKKWLGMPMIDVTGKTVYEAVVDVDRNTHSAYRVALNLFTPSALAVSDYPVADHNDLQRFFGSGGLLPLPREPAQDARETSFTSMEKVYVLVAGTVEHPTYVLPAIRAYWISEQTCRNCSPILFSTFVPALDQEQFTWEE